AKLAGMRHGMELPREFAGDDVIGAQIARWRTVTFARRGAEQDEILEHLPGSARLYPGHRCRIATQPFAKIDHTLCAERHDRLAGRCIHLFHEIVHAENQPAVASVCALSITHPARGHALHPVVDPDLPSSPGVERDDGAAAA